jgi:hypothetical protein
MVVQTFGPQNPNVLIIYFEVFFSWSQGQESSFIFHKSHNLNHHPILPLSWIQWDGNVKKHCWSTSKAWIGHLNPWGWSMTHWALDFIVILKKYITLQVQNLILNYYWDPCLAGSNFLRLTIKPFSKQINGQGMYPHTLILANIANKPNLKHHHIYHKNSPFKFLNKFCCNLLF